MQPGIGVGGVEYGLSGPANGTEPRAEPLRVVEPGWTTGESSSSHSARLLGLPVDQLTQPSRIDPHRAGWAEVVRVAVTDPLTRLPNRALLHDRLRQAIARLAQEPTELAVLFIDVDRFKLVNDALGRGAGDDLLVAVANRLSHTLRMTDTIARFGGDEFVVVAEDTTDAATVLALGRRLVDAVAEPLEVASHTMTPSISVGIAVASGPGEEPAELIHLADMAMCEAKDAGGGRCMMERPRSDSSFGRGDVTLRRREPWSVAG
ncbi:MAG: diguanylate cyclase domain-containing protein [Acidimicrobiales bacterium]